MDGRERRHAASLDHLRNTDAQFREVNIAKADALAVIRRAKTSHSSAPKTGHHVGGTGWKNPLIRSWMPGGWEQYDQVPLPREQIEPCGCGCIGNSRGMTKTRVRVAGRMATKRGAESPFV